LFENDPALRLIVLTALRQGLRAASREIYQQRDEQARAQFEDEAARQAEERRAIYNKIFGPGQS
jgi:hypothetical protein